MIFNMQLVRSSILKKSIWHAKSNKNICLGSRNVSYPFINATKAKTENQYAVFEAQKPLKSCRLGISHNSHPQQFFKANVCIQILLMKPNGFALSQITSSITVQMSLTHWMMASWLPDIVTPLSVELGRRSPATCTWAPVFCQTKEEQIISTLFYLGQICPVLLLESQLHAEFSSHTPVWQVKP